jgi:penicillin amidase
MAQLMPPYPADGLSIVGKSSTTEDTETNGVHGKDRTTPNTARRNEDRIPVLSRGLEGSAVRPVVSWASAFARALSTGDPSVSDFLLSSARSEAIGSNNWVVDGTLTASGKPLLANDPHLSARLPSTWYLAHVTGGDFDVVGATLPGAPAVALGRNRFIAWGATNVAADVEDLYRERLDATGTRAEFRGVQEPMTVITETIAVKGGDPVRVGVRLTRHGPLVSDAINANNAASREPGPKPDPLEPLAFRWTALDPVDTTLPSFLKLNEAHNWTEFTDALRDFVTPSQNFVYADVDGHIGYYAPGRIPIRASGDGSLAADGWTGDAEWTGWIPFDALPHLYDPPDHVIVTANHRPAPPTYPYRLGLEWPEPYRAQRVVDLIHSKSRFTADDFARIQADTVSLHAKTLLPLLLPRVRTEGTPDQRAIDLLRKWNGDSTGDSAAAAIFSAWFHQLAPVLVADDLGPLLTDRYKERYSYVTRFVVHTLATNDAAWCDDVATAKKETCEDAVNVALRKGIADLEQRLGSDMTRWRWDAVHAAVFPHQGLDSVAALRPLLSRSVPNGGDWSTVDVGAVDALHPYDQHTVPGYREIIDLSPANDSRFIDAVGESGHFLSKHYDDFQRDWQAVRHKKMRMERADIERNAFGHLRLTP